LGHRASVFCVCCSEMPYSKHANGRGAPTLLLGSVGQDWSVRIWRMLKRGDPSAWTCEATIMDATSAQYPGRPLHFMPNDASIIVTANAESVELWHLAPGDSEEDIIVGHKTVAKLEGHMSPVTCVQCRPDSKMIASCDSGGKVHLWHLLFQAEEEDEEEEEEEEETLVEQEVLTGSPLAVYQAAHASPTRQRTATRGADGVVGAGPISAFKGSRGVSTESKRPLVTSHSNTAESPEQVRQGLEGQEGHEVDGAAQVLRISSPSVRIDSPLGQREILREQHQTQLDMSSTEMLILEDAPATSPPTADGPLGYSGSSASNSDTCDTSNTCHTSSSTLDAIKRRMQWTSLSTSFAGNPNARALAFGTDFQVSGSESERERVNDWAMLAVSNNKGRVRMWNTAPLLPLGVIMSDSHSSPPSTAPPTPNIARPKTVVDKLSDLERGFKEMVPSWHTLGTARPGSCLALFPNQGKVAAGCYSDLQGAFIMWPLLPTQARTAAPRNAGGCGQGGEQRVFPHNVVITCMAALHREFTNGSLSAYVVTGAADGGISLTQLLDDSLAPDAAAPRSDKDKVVKRLVRVVPLGDGEYQGPSRPVSGKGTAHTGSVLHVQALGDGRQLLSTGQDGHVTIWDIATGAVVHDFVHVTPVLAVACAFPNIKHFALASLLPPPDLGGQGQLLGEQRRKAGNPGCIIFINVVSGAKYGEALVVHTTEIVCMSMSPLAEGVNVASCARGDSVIKITNMDEARVVQELGVSQSNAQDEAAPIYIVKYDASGKLLASSDAEGVVRLWSPVSGVLLSELRGHIGGVLAIDFPAVTISDGRPISRAGPKTPIATQLVSSGIDAQVRVWQFDSFVPQPTVQKPSTQLPSTLSTSHSGHAQSGGTVSVRLGEVVGKKGVKTAVNTIMFTSHISDSAAQGIQKHKWECAGVLKRESHVTQVIRLKVTQLCQEMGVHIDLEPPPIKREHHIVEAEDADEAEEEDEDGEVDGGEGSAVRVSSPSMDMPSDATTRALDYKTLLKLAEKMDCIGLIDPGEELEQAQARRTALWEERQREEALALARLSDEQRRRAERNRKPRTGPPNAPITVANSIQRRRAAAALLLRKMEDLQIRDAPTSIKALMRLLQSADHVVRTIAALGLGFLTSRSQVRPCDALSFSFPLQFLFVPCLLSSLVADARSLAVRHSSSLLLRADINRKPITG